MLSITIFPWLMRDSNCIHFFYVLNRYFVYNHFDLIFFFVIAASISQVSESELISLYGQVRRCKQFMLPRR